MKVLKTEVVRILDKWDKKVKIPNPFAPSVHLAVAEAEVTEKTWRNMVKLCEDEYMDLNMDQLQQLAGWDIDYD